MMLFLILTTDFVDADVDRWALGKQANLRALLSTLHCVSHLIFLGLGL